MKPIPGTLQEGGAAFQSTHWTLVLRARQSDPTETAREALSDFCEAYWPPLYTFLRLRGHAAPEAQDLVQGFFPHLIEKNPLSRADKEKGRLRTFLLGSLQNFLYNEYDRAHRLKRGGGHRIVSIDEHLPEAEASMMDTAHLSDSRGYDLAWASNIVKRAWEHVQNAFEAEGKAESLEVLRPFVDGSGRTPPNQEEAAESVTLQCNSQSGKARTFSRRPLLKIRTYCASSAWTSRSITRNNDSKTSRATSTLCSTP